MQLKQLWDLQELDLLINALKIKIEEAPALSGVEETVSELDEHKNNHLDCEILFREDNKILKKLEMDTQKIVEDRQELSDNLYGGKVTNVKELEQMQRKMDLLAAEKKRLEDKIIILMESVEEQETLLDHSSKDLRQLEQTLKAKEDQLAADLEKFHKELLLLETERSQFAEQIDTKYLNRYTLLAEKHQGRALARVNDDICGGCRVFISSGLRGRLYNPDAMVYCENCGRLLVIFEDQ